MAQGFRLVACVDCAMSWWMLTRKTALLHGLCQAYWLSNSMTWRAWWFGNQRLKFTLSGCHWVILFILLWNLLLVLFCRSCCWYFLIFTGSTCFHPFRFGFTQGKHHWDVMLGVLLSGQAGTSLDMSAFSSSYLSITN